MLCFLSLCSVSCDVFYPFSILRNKYFELSWSVVSCVISQHLILHGSLRSDSLWI
ncbi:hypothetical protein KFK09_022042 [Dendrobium nobile]|uniref:Uncharacterized protein n=1 Tax=Dendrobium nobile TaxID=94219 RepID=A0A8T3AHK4_DENNO|nr:hypothetical protein KFK09_022042 [Dendrobium nobile]